jgi:hypothetical protein
LPIIVIDLFGLINLFNRDEKEHLCGGRHQIIQKNVQSFLSRLSAVAELVFFQDGVVQDDKMDTWIQRNNEKYYKYLNVLEKIYEQRPLDEIVRDKKNLMSTTFHNPMTLKTAKKYGTVIRTITRECDSEIARYAFNNRRVIAVLAEDSDFLIFPGHWKYLSIQSFNLDTFMTKEYNRKALRDYLDLSSKGLSILATLNGNDVLQFERMEEFHKSFRRIGPSNYFKRRFPALAEYIGSLPGNKQQMIRQIAHDVFNDVSDEIMKKINDSLEMYNPVSD